jgi:hypothetical protein
LGKHHIGGFLGKSHSGKHHSGNCHGTILKTTQNIFEKNKQTFVSQTFYLPAFSDRWLIFRAFFPAEKYVELGGWQLARGPFSKRFELQGENDSWWTEHPFAAKFWIQ